MVYKFTSAKAVIAKIYRDFRPNISGWEQSALEWIGEAMSSIGHSATLYKKSTGNEGCDDAITILNHRAKLPCDLVNLQAVEYNGRKLPYGGDLTGYGLTQSTRSTEIYSNKTNIETDIIPGLSASTERLVDAAIGPEETITDYYLINPNYIQTSFSSGHIKLHYEAYPVCPDGFPLIPDEYNHLTALTWYVVSMLFLLGYQNQVIDYNQARQNWFEYRILARNKAAFPSIDKMERFRNMWVRLIPLNSLPDDFFAGGETKESIKHV